MQALDELDDVSLIRRYVDDGDPEAMGCLFKRYSDMAFRVALRVARNQADAQDAVQTAFVKIMRDVKKYRGGQGVRVWIMKNVASACKMKIRSNVRRRKREERAMEEPMDSSLENGKTQDLGELVKRVLDKLPERYRLPIWMHHYEGLPFAEMSGALDVPEATLRSHVSRGLKELRQGLGRLGVAVPAVAVVTALTSEPAEAAPIGLVESIGDIIQGVGDFTPGAATSQGFSWGGASLATKAVVTTGIVALSGAVVVTTLWLAEPSKHPALPVTPVLEGVIFQDSFESGMDGWVVQRGQWDVVDGEGVGGSRCLRLRWEPDTKAEIFARVVNPDADFEIRFKARTSGPEQLIPQVLVFGNMAKGGRVLGTMKPLMLAGPADRVIDSALSGKWQHYTYTIHGRKIQLTCRMDGKAVLEREHTQQVPMGNSYMGLYFRTVPPGSRLLYVDDVTIREIPPDPADPDRKGSAYHYRPGMPIYPIPEALRQRSL